MKIRIATKQDRDAIQRVYLSAFPEGENEIVSKLAIDLLSENTTPPTISLVAESGAAVVGHIAFSPVLIDDAPDFQGYILAPLAVKPDYQKRGLGSKLIEYGLRKLSARGVNIILVYGDPNFYGGFGFSAEAAQYYIPPYTLEYPAGWQAIVLNEYVFEKIPVEVSCVSSLGDPKLW